VIAKPSTIRFFPCCGKPGVEMKDVAGNINSTFCTKLTDGEVLLGLADKHFRINGNRIQESRDSLTNIRFVSSTGNKFWTCLANRRGARLVGVMPDGSEKLLRSLLEGYSVTDCQEDHEGGIWFSTLEKGIFYMPYAGVEMFVPSLMTGEKITSMVNYEGTPIVATSLGNLSRPGAVAHEMNDETIHSSYVSNLFASNHILFICAQYNSRLYNSEQEKNILVSNSTGTVPLYSVSNYDEKKFCALGVRSLNTVDKASGKVTVLYSFLPERMRAVAKGKGDTLWMGGLSGLWMYVPGKEPVHMAGLDSLLGERIDFLYYDPQKDRLWMSSKGVGLLLKEGQRVMDFSAYRPEIAATCRALNADEEGNIWVASNAGAFCVSEHEGKFSVREFSIRNGLSSNDIVGIARNADTVWMASSDRIMRFRLSNYPHNINPPLLFMRSIRVAGHEIDLAAPGNNSEFNHADNTIAFSFTGISYKAFGQVRYRFRLLGADTTWKETQANEVTFYSLPPGEYCFCLYALNNDGIAQATAQEYRFVILQPFWQRWWFILSAIIVLLLAVTFFIRFRIRRVHRKEIFNRRLIEMEMTALRAQMSPHFIFNAINSIHNFVLTGDKNSSSAYLAKFARLIRNVLENSGHKQIPLIKEIETLELYIEIERMRFSDGFNFKIETDPSLNLSSLMVVPLLLQPYVENAIWHGLLHKKSLGHLLISIKDEGTMLRCVIDDDGIGREQAELFKRQSNAGNNSMGGEISLRRLNLLNNLYGTKFSLNYKDKKNPDGTSAGTCVELLIPKVNKTESL
jgi:ligand-binding sensor domain-containing protein